MDIITDLVAVYGWSLAYLAIPVIASVIMDWRKA